MAQQIQDAVEFLRKNSDEMVRLVATQALRCSLDFGLSRGSGFLQCNYFPPELLRLAGALNVGIEISTYGEVQADDSFNRPLWHRKWE